MHLLLELIAVAVLALLARSFAPAPWRGRLLNLLKLYFTVRVFWILLAHRVKLDDGSTVAAWELIHETLRTIEAGPFWTFIAMAAGIKFVGILASMYRWTILLRGQGIDLPFPHIAGSFLIGRFIGTFLPSTAGLDGYKLYDASRFSGKTVEVTAATMLEKVLGVSGIFLSYLVALPFGIEVLRQHLHDKTALVAGLSVAVALGILACLLMVLWFPGILQWVLEHIPLPGKEQLSGLLSRLSHATAAYRDKKLLTLEALGLSFVVHFTTAAMYFFTALAIGAVGAHFWQITLGSSIQILATVLSPFTIAGEGIREAAQYLLLRNLIGPGESIVSAALGFWAAEALTLVGGVVWWVRKPGYTPSYSRVDGVQVDYAQAARAALSLDPQGKDTHAVQAGNVEPLGTRIRVSAGFGWGTGILAGLLIGIAETAVIAQGGFGGDAQVLWFGPLFYAVFLGVLGVMGGAVLGVLPMERAEIRGWTASLGLIVLLVPLGLAITLFRVRRDVFAEQMPPMPIVLGIVAAAGLLALLLFFLGRRIFSTRLGVVVRPGPATALLVAVSLVGGILAWILGPGEREAAADRGTAAELANSPNLILILVDTLRADHLSCYNPDAPPTPTLCSLAEPGGTRYTGFSHASWTKPATASLLTSLYPSSHQAISKTAKLSNEVTLLSEPLHDRGYLTGGVVSNINLAASFGFDQGYDEYHYLAPDYLFGANESSSKTILYNILRKVWFKLHKGLRVGDFYQDAQTVNHSAKDFLQRHQSKRFFLLIHYMDVHDPYFEHPYNGYAIARVGNDHPPEALAGEMHRLYRGEIAYLDAQLQDLIGTLKTLGLYDDALIVLTADHGEEFHEHGGFWHGLTLYEDQIHIPLIVKWPKGKAEAPPVVEPLVRHLDVAPTLLRRAGAVIPTAMQGVDLTLGSDQRNADQNQVFAEEDHEGNVLWAIRTNDWKYLRANEGNPRGLPPEELFSMVSDPDETEDLLAGHRAQADAYCRTAEQTQKRAVQVRPGEGSEAAISDEECQRLLVLGYVQDCSSPIPANASPAQDQGEASPLHCP